MSSMHQNRGSHDEHALLKRVNDSVQFDSAWPSANWTVDYTCSRKFYVAKGGEDLQFGSHNFNEQVVLWQWYTIKLFLTG